MAKTGQWPTPTVSGNYNRASYKGRSGDGLATAVSCSLAASDTSKPGSLNPAWVEWLMGFPDGWTDLDASATP